MTLGRCFSGKMEANTQDKLSCHHQRLGEDRQAGIPAISPSLGTETCNLWQAG